MPQYFFTMFLSALILVAIGMDTSKSLIVVMKTEIARENNTQSFLLQPFLALTLVQPGPVSKTPTHLLCRLSMDIL